MDAKQEAEKYCQSFGTTWKRQKQLENLITKEHGADARRPILELVRQMIKVKVK